MDTRLLRIFQSIAEHGGLAEAARHLHLTPSALSHGLKALETDLGARLFDRTSGRLHLNQAGEQLLASIQGPLAQIDAAAASVRALNHWGQGRLRVGSTASACQHILPRVLRDLRRDYPRLLLEIRSGDTPQLVEKLHRDEIDVILGVEPEPAPGLAIRGLFEDELLLAMAPEHPWADGRPISDRDLAREPLIVYRRSSLTHRLIDQHLAARRIAPAAVLEIESISAIKELVKLNLGVTVIAPWVADYELSKGQIKMRPLGSHALRRRWALTLGSTAPPALAIEKLYALCRREAAAMRLDRRDLPRPARTTARPG